MQARQGVGGDRNIRASAHLSLLQNHPSQRPVMQAQEADNYYLLSKPLPLLPSSSGLAEGKNGLLSLLGSVPSPPPQSVSLAQGSSGPSSSKTKDRYLLEQLPSYVYFSSTVDLCTRLVCTRSIVDYPILILFHVHSNPLYSNFES